MGVAHAQNARVVARVPEPADPVIEPWLGDQFPDYDHEPVFAEN